MGEPLRNLVSRQEALSQGLTRYFTGKACKHGHVDERITKGRGCITCMARFSKETYQRAKASGKPWVKEIQRKHYAANVEKRRASQKAWRDKNKEFCAARMKKWQKENPRICAHHANLRKARLLQATPSWVDLNEIKEIYKRCPEGFHVDHIFPLVSEHLCGLHVPWNLQYLPASENMAKGNKVGTNFSSLFQMGNPRLSGDLYLPARQHASEDGGTALPRAASVHLHHG